MKLRRNLVNIVLSGIILSGCGNPNPAGPSIPKDNDIKKELWIAPAPGSQDLLDMFEKLDQWPKARAKLSGFQFYHEQVYPFVHPDVVESNFFENFEDVHAFSKLKEWKIPLSIEAGSVKSYHCASPTGMINSFNSIAQSIDAIAAAGGAVDSVGMQEPFFEGRTRQECGLNDRFTYPRVKEYYDLFRKRYPDIKLGLIDAYPSIPAYDLAAILRNLSAGGAKMDYFHVDIDMDSVKRQDKPLANDLRLMSDACKELGIPFGIDIWSNNMDSDTTFYSDAKSMLFQIMQTGIHYDRLVAQSWEPDASNPAKKRIPHNLPEEGNDPTMTKLVLEIDANVNK